MVKVRYDKKRGEERKRVLHSLDACMLVWDGAVLFLSFSLSFPLPFPPPPSAARGEASERRRREARRGEERERGGERERTKGPQVVVYFLTGGVAHV
jgi:hypothetical protein